MRRFSAGRLELDALAGTFVVVTEDQGRLYGTVESAAAPLLGGELVDGVYSLKEEGGEEGRPSGDSDLEDGTSEGDDEDRPGTSSHCPAASPGSSSPRLSGGPKDAEEDRLRPRRGWVTRVYPSGLAPPAKVPSDVLHPSVVRFGAPALRTWARVTGVKMWPVEPAAWAFAAAGSRGFGGAGEATLCLGTKAGVTVCTARLSPGGKLDMSVVRELARQVEAVLLTEFNSQPAPTQFSCRGESVTTRRAILRLYSKKLELFVRGHADLGPEGRRLVKAAAKVQRTLQGHFLALNEVQRWKMTTCGGFDRREEQLFHGLESLRVAVRRVMGVELCGDTAELVAASVDAAAKKGHETSANPPPPPLLNLPPASELSRVGEPPAELPDLRPSFMRARALEPASPLPPGPSAGPKPRIRLTTDFASLTKRGFKRLLKETEQEEDPRDGDYIPSTPSPSKRPRAKAKPAQTLDQGPSPPGPKSRGPPSSAPSPAPKCREKQKSGGSVEPKAAGQSCEAQGAGKGRKRARRNGAANRRKKARHATN